MAEVINLGDHHHQIMAEAIRVSMDDDRLKHWQQNAVAGCHIPMGFPAAVRFADASLEDQLAAVFSEARELAEDLADPEKSKDGTWLLEAMDLHHAMETMWRMVADRFGVDVVNNARAMTIEKNAGRGYYMADDHPAEG